MGFKTVCTNDICAGCMACINICPREAIVIDYGLQAYNALMDKDKCINCDLCEKVCPNACLNEQRTPIIWKQGWAEDDIRKTSSSGGAASAIIKAFIRSGGMWLHAYLVKASLGST